LWGTFPKFCSASSTSAWCFTAFCTFAKAPTSIWRTRSAASGEFLAHLSKPGDETVTLYADGTAVEIPVF
jgi:hypothetical protein